MNEIPPKISCIIVLPIIIACLLFVIPAILWKPGSTFLANGDTLTLAIIFILISGFSLGLYLFKSGED